MYDERLFGSLHFVPRPLPVNECSSVWLIVASVTWASGCEPLHRAAGRVVVEVLADVERRPDRSRRCTACSLSAN